MSMDEIKAFLKCETPDAWVVNALENQDTLLIDHANCEKKAAATAVNLMYRYVDRLELLNKMSRLAREELRHFEQVLALMKKRKITYGHLTPSRYANGLRAHAKNHEPDKLIDILIIGAIIEARSCERFSKLAPFLDDDLQKFYLSLLKSESRHFQDYLDLAKDYADFDITERVALFLDKEKALILEPDEEFRFHSGPISVS
ncbi:MAG: tRNA-(ms[2]io[6]A)-hydroxylase [Hahellaceae bacterium]|nr:tRNA-(ms[2]io[6]A)-hydroxylase [Hahellaceae bacterium]MCP5211902.1 tRNA-(ms[2]io[6]A)-hydroxylase [Hahellaceae bacterium]